MTSRGVGVAEPKLIRGVGEGTGVKGFSAAWFNTSKPTAINAENEPAIRYQRALTTYL
jgi:hypothetical protein